MKSQTGPGRRTWRRRTATRRCPLVQAALRLGDPAVIAIVHRIHPAEHCPARRERAA